ncbi:hypothetical protein C3R31_21275, partial [Mycobacterium tuberculosis]
AALAIAAPASADLLAPWRSALAPARALWACWLLAGLPGPRWALLLPLPPCLAGALSAAPLLARLCAAAAGRAFAPHVALPPLPPYGAARR